MKTITLYVTESEVSTVGEMPPVIIGLGQPTKERASHVVPLRPHTRAIFYWLRNHLGSLGTRLSRHLPGPWKATIIETGEIFISHSRQRCIQWEVNELQRLMERN